MLIQSSSELSLCAACFKWYKWCMIKDLYQTPYQPSHSFTGYHNFFINSINIPLRRLKFLLWKDGRDLMSVYSRWTPARIYTCVFYTLFQWPDVTAFYRTGTLPRTGGEFQFVLQSGCAIWYNRPKLILNSNLLESRSPITYVSVVQLLPYVLCKTAKLLGDWKISYKRISYIAQTAVPFV